RPRKGGGGLASASSAPAPSTGAGRGGGGPRDSGGSLWGWSVTHGNQIFRLAREAEPRPGRRDGAWCQAQQEGLVQRFAAGRAANMGPLESRIDHPGLAEGDPPRAIGPEILGA